MTTLKNTTMNKMKTLWAVALAALTMMPACSSDDDWDYDPETGMPVSPTEIPEAIRSAFYAQYGDGARVQWSKKDGYAVADFDGAGPGGEQTVWYGMTDGAWAMTEAEILFSALPESVAAAFAATEYAAAPWHVGREVDVLRRSAGETLYVIEVEKNENGRETEADLFFTEAGVLAKVVLDADREAGYSGYLPQQPGGSIEAWLAEHFPGAGIVDVERENGGTEVEIVWDGLAHDIIFDATGNWVRTKTEYGRRDLDRVPQAVILAAEAAAPGAVVEEVERYETAANGIYYVVDMENGRYDDMELYIDEQGNVMERPQQPDRGEGSVGTGVPVADDVAAAIGERYPGAVILEKDYDDGYMEIDIRHDGRIKEVRFNGRGEWVDTTWDVRPDELPAAVSTSLAENYAAWRASEAEAVEFELGRFYLVELDGARSAGELTVKLAENGHVLAEWRD